ncbi:MAG: Holliday junction branch migration protein RuvA [Legionellales bacterium]|nr:Holliday junction branch migration protein RuvA [Legionellales bacterium]
MIAFLTGTIIAVDMTTVIVKTNTGLGYEVDIAGQQQYHLHDTVELIIHHHIREDSQKLFGFHDLQSRDLFRVLLKTSGVGPKSALTILTYKPPQTVIQAIIGKQPELLSGIKGVGSKLIHKIIIECQPSLKNWVIDEQTVDNSKQTLEGDATVALEQLGYKSQSAKNTVKKLLDQKAYDDIQQLIVDALKEI